MLARRERRRFTPEEYLALEERSTIKSEYRQGEIYAMSGASVEHNQIVRNFGFALNGNLQGSDCQVFVSDLRLHIEKETLFTYPDLFVVCGSLPRMPGRSDTLTDARLIVEVLTSSTALYDRGEKFQLYQSLPSFCEYVLVDQAARSVEVRQLLKPGSWSSQLVDKDEVISLQSLDVQVELADIYRGVEFPG